MMYNERNDVQLLCQCVKISCTKNMGNLKTLFSRTMRKKREENSEVDREAAIIKTIWQTVEKDSAYYGFSMCTTLFKNYPQYAKYFENEAIPEFVREAKVKKKFTTICDIMSALFINYNAMPVQRDYLLGYIAMVHKDMGLTIQDFENFVSCITEALNVELPQLMTPENMLVQVKYFNILSETVIVLMEKNRAKIDELSLAATKDDKRCSPCFPKETYRLYNYPLKYWLYKKRYWEYRRAVWASLDMGPAMGTAAVSDARTLRLRNHRRVLEQRRAGQRRQIGDAGKRGSSDSDQNPGDERLEIRRSVRSWLQESVHKQRDLPSSSTVPKQFPAETTRQAEQRNETPRGMQLRKKSTGVRIMLHNRDPDFPMSVIPRSPGETTAVSKQRSVARERKRLRNSNEMSLNENWTKI